MGYRVKTHYMESVSSALPPFEIWQSFIIPNLIWRVGGTEKDFVNMRLVCRGWKDIVDRFVGDEGVWDCLRRQYFNGKGTLSYAKWERNNSMFEDMPLNYFLASNFAVVGRTWHDDDDEPSAAERKIVGCGFRESGRTTIHGELSGPHLRMEGFGNINVTFKHVDQLTVMWSDTARLDLSMSEIRVLEVQGCVNLISVCVPRCERVALCDLPKLESLAGLRGVKAAELDNLPLIDDLSLLVSVQYLILRKMNKVKEVGNNKRLKKLVIVDCALLKDEGKENGVLDITSFKLS